MRWARPPQGDLADGPDITNSAAVGLFFKLGRAGRRRMLFIAKRDRMKQVTVDVTVRVWGKYFQAAEPLGEYAPTEARPRRDSRRATTSGPLVNSYVGGPAVAKGRGVRPVAEEHRVAPAPRRPAPTAEAGALAPKTRAQSVKLAVELDAYGFSGSVADEPEVHQGATRAR